MNAKAKGTRAERRAMRLLEAAGYSCTKAGGSLGLFDVIAIGPRDVRLVQVKSGGEYPVRESNARRSRRLRCRRRVCVSAGGFLTGAARR